MVVFVLLLLYSLVEGRLGAVEAFLALLSLQTETRCGEAVGSLACDSETTLVKVFVDALIVGSGQQVDAVEHTVAQLICRQTLDVSLKGVLMVRAVVPRLLSWARLLRQKLLHALLSVSFVVLCLGFPELKKYHCVRGSIASTYR